MSLTTDSGSDVKFLCSTLLAGSLDWCIAHLLNGALVEAFGTGLNSQPVRNASARSISKEVKKFIKHLSKSAPSRTTFESIQVGANAKPMKLKRDVSHRLLSTFALLERILKLWEVLARHEDLHESSQFWLLHDHQVQLELFSLMLPVSECIRHA